LIELTKAPHTEQNLKSILKLISQSQKSLQKDHENQINFTTQYTFRIWNTKWLVKKWYFSMKHMLISRLWRRIRWWVYFKRRRFSDKMMMYLQIDLNNWECLIWWEIWLIDRDFLIAFLGRYFSFNWIWNVLKIYKLFTELFQHIF
jgi:hypothetical protein